MWVLLRKKSSAKIITNCRSHQSALVMYGIAALQTVAMSSCAQKEGSSEDKGEFGKRVMKPNKANKDTLRILVSTDNHLGFMENDPIRKEDSFRTFEEIFQIAEDNRCDLVLLGGDLFHENKPSRSAYYKCVQTLRKYCFGSRPIEFEVVSDQSVNFHTTGVVNFEDPNYNISLPVFSIHGNHDDPSGSGGYSAMDLLNSVNLVNYFGKAEQPDSIQNYPILLTKGQTKVALYGLGNIRDERLHRTFMQGNVRWIRPAESKDDWFNVMTIHQNRTKHSQLQKNFISEKMLPSFLDLVIWAHEHECLIQPETSEERNFSVTQPGSSVATSMSPGEATEKKVGIMEIRQDNYRMVPVKLETVRPFLMADVKLSEDLDEFDFTTEDIEQLLEEKVNALVEQATPTPPQGQASDLRLPLIRLRVDYTGFEKIHIQRFGQKFVGKVANPEAILKFQKKVATQRKGASGDKGMKMLEIAPDIDVAPPIHDLVKAILEENNDRRLQLLTMGGLSEAVRLYVEKKEASSILDFVESSLEHMQIHVRSGNANTPQAIEEDISKHFHQQMAKEQDDNEDEAPQSENLDDEDSPGEGSIAGGATKEEPVEPASRKRPRDKHTSRRSKNVRTTESHKISKDGVEPVSVINILSDDEADDFFDQDAPAKKLKQPTISFGSKVAKKKKPAGSSKKTSTTRTRRSNR